MTTANTLLLYQEDAQHRSNRSQSKPTSLYESSTASNSIAETMIPYPHLSRKPSRLQHPRRVALLTLCRTQYRIQSRLPFRPLDSWWLAHRQPGQLAGRVVDQNCQAHPRQQMLPTWSSTNREPLCRRLKICTASWASTITFRTYETRCRQSPRSR